jgi:hypothetical protein
VIAHPALGAVLFVLASAAGSSGDWALTIYGQKPICAVDEVSCQKAIAALNSTPQRLGWVAPGTPMRCDPAPNCRDPRELCIAGYRGARAEGFCE